MKIGIISHYYKSLNYGGNLQAYALCTILSILGEDAEQICFPLKGELLPWEKAEKTLSGKIKSSIKSGKLFCKILHRLIRTVQKTEIKLFIPSLRENRCDAFSDFNNKIIPHSNKVYNSKSIGESVSDYDAFITGSDQVWNFKWYNPAYFLDFVPEDKPKFSYGASMSMDTFTADSKKLFKKSLDSFLGISVREKSSSKFLSDVLQKNVQWVLDPTLLLEREHWDQVCADKIIEGKYLFCYFLSSSSKERKLAEKFAKKKGLKVVTIPHLDGEFIFRDVFFGDIKLPCPSPEEFISLIKYSEYVFTDSFHATVFSSIFDREYFVFPRKGNRGMDSRIYTLTQLLESGHRFCDSNKKSCLSYLLNCSRTRVKTDSENLKMMKDKSLNYLKECIKKSKEKIDVNEN